LIFFFVLAPIDLALLVIRKIFGRPRVLVGRWVYSFLMRPLRSVWAGEIPALKLVRLRYLTRLLLFYYAQSRINALHNVFNRRHLDLLFTDPTNTTALTEVEDLQKSFDIFQKITKDSYQFGALAVGGPLVALFSVVIQKGLFPLVSLIWNYFGGPDLALSHEHIGGVAGFVALFVVCAIWVLISAWIDLRSLLIKFGVPDAERNVFADAKIAHWRDIPYDILFYLSVVGIYLWIFTGAFVSPEQLGFEQADQIEVWEVFGVLLCFGLVALIRRIRPSGERTLALIRRVKQALAGFRLARFGQDRS
jgi:hypothetical protein